LMPPQATCGISASSNEEYPQAIGLKTCGLPRKHGVSMGLSWLGSPHSVETWRGYLD
jgi:hypothetical protein